VVTPVDGEAGLVDERVGLEAGHVHCPWERREWLTLHDDLDGLGGAIERANRAHDDDLVGVGCQRLPGVALAGERRVAGLGVIAHRYGVGAGEGDGGGGVFEDAEVGDVAGEEGGVVGDFYLVRCGVGDVAVDGGEAAGEGDGAVIGEAAGAKGSEAGDLAGVVECTAGGVERARWSPGVGQPSRAPDGQEGRFLIRDTWNTDIVAELRPLADDVVLYKHRFSGFYQTELDDILCRLAIKNLIFTGCTTSICVDSTIRDAMFRDYRCVLLADCAGEPIGSDLARSNHDATLLVIQTLFGWVSRSYKFIEAVDTASVGRTQR